MHRGVARQNSGKTLWAARRRLPEGNGSSLHHEDLSAREIKPLPEGASNEFLNVSGMQTTFSHQWSEFQVMTYSLYPHRLLSFVFQDRAAPIPSLDVFPFLFPWQRVVISSGCII